MAETKKYYHNIDADNNKIINPLLNPLTTVQRTTIGGTLTLTEQGYVVFDTTLNQQYFWNGTAWIVVGGSATWGAITGTLTAQTDLTAYLTANYYPLSTNPAGYLTSSALTPYLTSATAALTYEPIIAAGTTSQYWRGDKTWQTFPTIPAAQIQSDWNQTNNTLLDYIKNKPTIPTVGTWGALNYPSWTSGTPFVKMTAVGTFALDTNTYLTSAVTSIATAGLISGGTITGTGTITTSIATNKLVGRSSAGTGVMEEITVGTGLSLSGGTLSTTGGGTVTSVDLTMPSAFNVTGNPVTNSGTLAVTGAGVVSQYIRGDGSLANFPTSTGGGSSVSYYFNGSVAQGTIGGVAFKQMSKTPIIGAGTDFTINADGYIQSFITDAGDPALLNIPVGNWNFEMYFSASSGGGSPRFYVELYKWDGTTLSLISSSSANPEGITNGTAIDLYTTALAVPATTLLATDRLAVRVYVIHSGRTITLHTQDSHLCQVITTFTTGLTALNGLTAQVQNFADDTNVTMVSSGSTHTITWAGTLADGRIASASTWNSKQNSRSVNVVSLNTAAGSAASTDYVYLVSGTTTITLPTAVGNTNRYTIKRSGTGVVSIATTSSQTIDGSSSPITINVQYVSIDLISNGANWEII